MEEEDDLWKQFLEQDDDVDDLTVPSQVLSDSYLIGFVIANIVGLRYYSGTINGRELVGLVREPLNPYDSNAIKVLNTRTVQVGHIERTVAAVLAPLLDAHIISAVEAIVPKPPRNGRNPYRLPCQIHIFALPNAIPTVQCAIEDGGLHLFTPDDHEFTLSESAIVKESAYSNASKERRRIDEIFALVGKERKGIERLEPPKDVILTELFDHQKEGLGWLVHRENSKDLPLFWKEKNGGFLNVLTNHLTNERPEPLRGGMFADDMGLGKTLTLLSLIASAKAGASVSYAMVDDVGTSSGTRKRRSGNKRAVGSRKKLKADVDELLGTKTTLVVCPSSVLTTWITQLEQHTRAGSLQVYLYHGERIKEVKFLLRHDILLTTYKTLALEFSSPQSPLKEIEWARVILDEAHVIKNFGSQQTKAVVELKAQRRWVVTGTPIQNSSFDLFSLMAFLRFQPFSIKSYWQSLIQRPLDQGCNSGISRLQALMAGISLRRMKGTNNGSDSLVLLPPKTVETYLVELTSEEREQYEKMESEAKSTLKEYINDDAVLRNYSTVLHIILRLRQICNNVALCPSDLKSLLSSNSLEDVSKNPELLKKLTLMLADGDDFDCPVCLSPPKKTIITCCAHIFCQTCILKALKTLNPRCPLCREPLSETKLFLAPPPKPSDENPTTNFSGSPISSKASALLNLLHESKKQNESTKSVVFSQFRKMLILLEEPLKAAGFGILRLDGSMSTKKRAAVIKEFGSDQPNAPTVLLASLKAAGAGLNLSAASRVYLVEPWWNPAAEEQAMDRVHRIGQKEEVKVVRLIVKDSIEERILVIQERKKKLAGGLFGKKAAKLQREMRVDDIHAMLRL
ncbi:putative SWI/SNF-related matrix-associated actin-dependent regulator of chromatin subfamily A member 3-like 1 [Phalaenopsis equestris]|uniref:putative SWI/SNF-related matrix-associated actin-dependent regulator of chromatin subfamily A member 3-like 1 n=1 Tax=Phalaenopsis equestris TaxID=78828 RepID=UPI0009E56809|nr:putative SWI/SNF-related matrix-associated actin-dependent regulator of chromatin subfamily A member 3-like 1 [Phalaenopsis equestris]